MGALLTITDHSSVIDQPGIANKYTYEVMYNNRKSLVESELCFRTEMSVMDRQRFIETCMIPAFTLEFEAKMEERPEDLEYVDDADEGYEEDEEDGEYENLGDILIDIMKRLDKLDGGGRMGPIEDSGS